MLYMDKSNTIMVKKTTVTEKFITQNIIMSYWKKIVDFEKLQASIHWTEYDYLTRDYYSGFIHDREK